MDVNSIPFSHFKSIADGFKWIQYIDSLAMVLRLHVKKSVYQT